MTIKPDLSQFDNTWYDPGRPALVRALWFFLGLPVLRSHAMPFSGPRRRILQLFGARLGQGVVIKPGVRVKHPWHLSVGDNVWLGEDVWVDNVGPVEIGSDVCISQAAYICTGNHDWSDPAFGLVVKPIVLGKGSWVAARTVICPGVTVGEGAIATAGSVVTNDIPAFEIYAGNPARFLRTRQLRTVQKAAKTNPQCAAT